MPVSESGRALDVDQRRGNVLRATRLMQLFNDQVVTMAKPKVQGGQQRVVVDQHYTGCRRHTACSLEVWLTQRPVEG